MPDITVHRHGDRWAVRESGSDSAVKEFPTREAAELAARQMASGGGVEVLEDDPTGLEHVEGGSERREAGAEQGPTGAGAAEGVRSRQPGL